MRILLIVPRLPGGVGVAPNLGIVAVAALTPPDFEIKVVDENIDPLNFDEDVDLVGITVMTTTALRSYEIAEAFRNRGKTVVLGGFHPSLIPEESIQHADAIVIGEAEGIWPGLLRDFESGKLKKFYRLKKLADLSNLPIPRRDLLKLKAYRMHNTMETARGCPFNCNFCSVSSLFGHTYRFRPINDVIKEVETLDGKFIFFVDDNIVGMPARAKKLFKALIPFGKKWIGQASTTFARDKELIRLAARSGCIGLFIGFESVSQTSLREAGKSFNIVNKYKDAIKKIHAHGIAIHGSFIFGFDHDDEGIFEKTVEFVKKSKLDSASFATLTPFPGTPIYQKLSKENRIVTTDWNKYGGAVFKPKRMSLETLDQGCKWAWKKCFSYKAILGRLTSLKRYWFIHLLLNIVYKHAIKDL